MKKTILCTVIGSVFSLNASAAVLDVKGEIRVNGTTALATVNLNNYMAPSGTTQTYTAPDCSYASDEKVCGTYTKNVTVVTDGGSNYSEKVEVIDLKGNVESSYILTRNGSEFSEQGESRREGVDIGEWVEGFWADLNGEPIVINGFPANDGMYRAECQVEDPSTVEGCSDDPSWHPDTENGDHWVDGYQKQIPYIEVHSWSQTWTGVELTPRNDSSVVMGVPTTRIWKTTNSVNTSESWKIIDGVKVPQDGVYYPHSGSADYSNGLNDDTFTVTGKIPVYNGYSDCIAVVEGNDEFRIQCANVGTVFVARGDSGGYREWILVSQ